MQDGSTPRLVLASFTSGLVNSYPSPASYPAPQPDDPVTLLIGLAAAILASKAVCTTVLSRLTRERSSPYGTYFCSPNLNI